MQLTKDEILFIAKALKVYGNITPRLEYKEHSQRLHEIFNEAQTVSIVRC